MCWMDDECQTEPSLASNTQAAGTQITNRACAERAWRLHVRRALRCCGVALRTFVIESIWQSATRFTFTISGLSLEKLTADAI